MKRNRIMYFFLLLSSIIFIYFYGGEVPYMLFYTILLLGLLSFAYAATIYFRFKFYQEVDKKFLIKGDNVNYNFIISNEDILFYPYIKVKFFGAETIFREQFKTRELSLLPLREKKITLNLSCKYSGNYEVGVDRIEISDFLGLFNLVYKVPFPLALTVYPRIIILERFNLKTDFFSESYSVSDSNYEDIGALQDIRKYAYGDSLKKVHWKLTAKLNKLMIRKFQSATEASVAIVLDLKKNSLNFTQNTIIQDKIIESTIAVIYYCLQRFIPTTLVYYSKEITTIKANNPFDFQNIYKYLSEIRFASDFNVSELLDVYIKNNVIKSNLLIITSNLSYDLYNAIHYSTFSGYNTVILYISPEEFTGTINEDTENIIKNIPKIGAYIYRININDEIKAILEK